MKINLKVALLQDQPGSGIRDDYMRILKNAHPEILALPEYYFVRPGDDSVIVSSFRCNEIKSQMMEWSRILGCILIGGSIVEEDEGRLYNRSYLFDCGTIKGYYDKIHPYDNEGRSLIAPGFEYKAFCVRGFRIGILICADVLYPSSFSNIRGLRPHMIFVPVTSPYIENEPRQKKFSRDKRLFASGARLADSIIFKVCASGSIIHHRLQGRSLITTPEDIRWRIEPEFEDKSALAIISCTGDIRYPSLDIAIHRR